MVFPTKKKLPQIRVFFKINNFYRSQDVKELRDNLKSIVSETLMGCFPAQTVSCRLGFFVGKKSPQFLLSSRRELERLDNKLIPMNPRPQKGVSESRCLFDFIKIEMKHFDLRAVQKSCTYCRVNNRTDCG